MAEQTEDFPSPSGWKKRRDNARRRRNLTPEYKAERARIRAVRAAAAGVPPTNETGRLAAVPPPPAPPPAGTPPQEAGAAPAAPKAAPSIPAPPSSVAPPSGRPDDAAGDAFDRLGYEELAEELRRRGEAVHPRAKEETLRSKLRELLGG